jgi:tetratricopeptide (TPR) repeat protein
MKGLVLNAMGRKDEADEAVKRSLKADILSSLCWHVYGIISRSNRNFEQALRCYRRALKADAVSKTVLIILSGPWCHCLASIASAWCCGSALDRQCHRLASWFTSIASSWSPALGITV